MNNKILSVVVPMTVFLVIIGLSVMTTYYPIPKVFIENAASTPFICDGNGVNDYDSRCL
jgi:hypothetical protein